MPTLQELYETAVRDSSASSISEMDVRILLCHIQGIDEMSQFYMRNAEEIIDLQCFQADFARLLNGEPVQYIVRSASFLNREYYVDDRVLIPRMETEEVVRYAEDMIRTRLGESRLTIADIGTGSGIIAISLKKLFPRADVYATDISARALEVAKLNSEFHQASLSFLEGSCLEPLMRIKHRVNVIISNPPYITNTKDIARSVFDYEPHLALVDVDDMLVYRTILRTYRLVADFPCLIIFEIGYDMHDRIVEMMEGLSPKPTWEIIKDINNVDRILSIKIEK